MKSSIQTNAGFQEVKHKKRVNSIKISPYIFIAPAVIYLAIVTIIPMILAFPISLTDWTALTPKMSFVGLDNYRRLFQDQDFLNSIIVTLKFFLSVPLTMVLGLILAMLLNNKLKGMTVFRVIFYSPVITSTVAAAVLFDWFYQPTFGLFNSILNAVGLQGIGWVSDASTSAMSIVLFKVWKTTGASMLIYLAGLQDVSEANLEAAQIDGAGWWQRFRYIVFPQLRPAHIYLVITGVIGVFMIFQETYMFQNISPLRSTESVVNYIYFKGFLSSEMGYASAMSFVLFIVIFAITIFQYKAMKVDVN